MDPKMQKGNFVSGLRKTKRRGKTVRDGSFSECRGKNLISTVNKLTKWLLLKSRKKSEEAEMIHRKKSESKVRKQIGKRLMSMGEKKRKLLWEVENREYVRRE